jgi:hypothetical protein
MKTYEDITTRQQVEKLSALDLIAEASTLNTPYEMWRYGAYNAEAIEILWVPSVGRAGIAWGADAQWTDADSVEDAVQRFFGVDDKEMCN